MEEYHLPTVHKASLQLLEMKHGIVPVRGNWDVIREKGRPRISMILLRPD